jgi:hypothetical protein
MPEVTIDTDDPKLRQRLWCVLGDEAVVGAVLERLAPPEPAEPPPGVYQDQDGCVWYCTDDASGLWRQAACNSWLPWQAVIQQGRMALPLVPLWTAAELIPDPDDDGSVLALGDEAANGYSFNPETVAAVCRVLRARAESRVPTGGPDGG